MGKFLSDEETSAIKREAGTLLRGFIADVLGVTPDQHPDVVEAEEGKEAEPAKASEPVKASEPSVSMSGAPNLAEFDSVKLSNMAQTQLVDVFALIESERVAIDGRSHDTTDAEKASVHLMKALAILGPESSAVLMGFCMHRFTLATANDLDNRREIEVHTPDRFRAGISRARDLYERD